MRRGGRGSVHFSGHGINNQVVSISKTMDDEVKSLIPVGECLVGTDGSFCAIRIIQHLLTFASAEVITVTLDCCRSLKRGLMQTIRLPWSPDIPRKCWLKMVVVHSTLETLSSNDCNSLSKELSKVYHENEKIPISKLARLVNESWQNRNIGQSCEMKIVDHEKWDTLYWPL